MLGTLWRTVWTGISFLLFGFGALLFGLVYAPILNLVVRNRERRRQHARKLISRLFGGFINFMALFLMNYRVSGLDGSRDLESMVVVANHPTLIDAVFLLWLFPGADCVVKGSHWRNPLMAFAVRAADYIRNDDNESLLEQSVERLKAGGCLLLFPEGTRTRPGAPTAFRRGAATITLRSGAGIVPVRLDCQPPTLRKGEPWYHVPDHRAEFSVEILNPLEPEQFEPRMPEKTRSIVITETLKSMLLRE